MLSRNPNKRLGSSLLDANELKQHPFFAGIDFNKITNKQFIPIKFKKENKEKSIKEFVHNKEILEDMKCNKKSADTSIEGWTFIGNNKYIIKQQ